MGLIPSAVLPGTVTAPVTLLEQRVCLTITIDNGDQQLQVVLCLLY